MAVPKKKMIEMYTTMLKIRMFETRVSELFAANKIPGVVHLYIGEEAVAAGVCRHMCLLLLGHLATLHTSNPPQIQCPPSFRG